MFEITEDVCEKLWIQHFRQRAEHTELQKWIHKRPRGLDEVLKESIHGKTDGQSDDEGKYRDECEYVIGFGSVGRFSQFHFYLSCSLKPTFFPIRPFYDCNEEKKKQGRKWQPFFFEEKTRGGGYFKRKRMDTRVRDFFLPFPLEIARLVSFSSATRIKIKNWTHQTSRYHIIISSHLITFCSPLL